jgi:hypothetical protein
MQMIEQKLNDANILEDVSSDTPELRDTSLFILVFHAIGGVLSSILILVLLLFTLSNMFGEPVAIVVIGMLFITLSFLVLRNNSNDFLEYFALVFVITGEYLFLMGLGEIFGLSPNIMVLLVLIVSVILFFLIDITLHRFFASLMILGTSFYFAGKANLMFVYADLLSILMVWIWVNEYKNFKYLRHIQVFGYALVVFLLLAFSDMTMMRMSDMGINIYPDAEASMIELPNYVSMILYYVVGVIMMAMILFRFGLEIKDKLFLVLIFATVVFYAVEPVGLHLSLSFFILLLAFYGQNLTLMVLGIFGMIQSIFSFYALTYMDFVTKSQMLLMFGIVVLSLAFVLHLYLKKEEGAKHA